MLTQCRKSLFLDAGDLHLRNAENFGRFVLRQAVKIAQADDHLLAVGELGDRLAQRNAFQYFLLHFSLGQDVLQRKAVLAGAPLQGLRRAGGCLGYGDVLRLQGRGLAQLCQRWLAAERAGQPLTRGADEGGAFLQAAADLDGAVVPQKAADLARDLRDNVL